MIRVAHTGFKTGQIVDNMMAVLRALPAVLPEQVPGLTWADPVILAGQVHPVRVHQVQRLPRHPHPHLPPRRQW